MKKSKLWAKFKIREELDRWWGVEGGIDEDGIKYVLNIIEQIEEPEVLSKNLPVVPTWFDKWWRNIIKGERNLFHNIKLFHDELYNYGTEEMYDYINNPVNKKKLLNIIVNELDYEVEDEQKYYVDLDTAAYVAKCKDNDRVDIYTDGISGSDEFEFHLTEEEIKNYDPRYWPFAVKVEEVEE